MAIGALGLGTAAVIATAAPASAATIIGGIDVARQCQVQERRPLEVRLLDSGNPYSWRCYSPYTGNYYSVNMNAACVNQYGSGAFPVVLDPHNAYSWRCAR
ncbi:hypothetical protein GCM10010174_02900 [Kutzneria viridogrisea]